MVWTSAGNEYHLPLVAFDQNSSTKYETEENKENLNGLDISWE
jgi:hypothetical protein